MPELQLLFISFAIVIGVMHLLIRLAPRLGLIDHPDQRKQHNVPVPAIGGLALYVMLMALLISGIADSKITGYLILTATLITCIGAIDDRFRISPLWRLLVQFLAAAILVFGADLRLEYVGHISLSGENIHLGKFSAAVTLFGIVSVINAMNFIDGLDGLAGGIALIALAGLWVLFGLTGGAVPDLVLVLIGGLAAFMLFNARWFGRKKASVFLGDAGSTLIGLLVAALMVEHTQGKHAVMSPVVALWLFAVPLLDLLITVLRRLIAKRSPFLPDRDHLHYRLTRAASDERLSVLIIHNTAFVCACIGVTAQMFNWPMNIMLYLFISLFLMAYFITRRYPPVYQPHLKKGVDNTALGIRLVDDVALSKRHLPEQITANAGYLKNLESQLQDARDVLVEEYPDAK